MTGYQYIGNELDLFEKAVNWKTYYRETVRPYINGDVLEVGAGTGNNTRLFAHLPHTSWTCLEPDEALLAQLAERTPPRPRTLVAGTLSDLPRGRTFDSILYVDVLEHIREDREELDRGSRLLRPGGHLIVLSPAHQWLYTPFDEAIGHERRYTRATLAALCPAALRQVLLVYLDSAGLLASMGNRMLLRQSMPAVSQILFWDRFLVPCSRLLDPLFGRRLGKSVLGVWRKPA